MFEASEFNVFFFKYKQLTNYIIGLIDINKGGKYLKTDKKFKVSKNKLNLKK